MQFKNAMNPIKKVINFLILFSFFWVGSIQAADSDPQTIIYLTWQRDPLTTMTICWIAEDRFLQDTVYFRPKGEETWKEAKTKPNKITQSRKNVYFLELTGLAAGSSYEFRMGGSEEIHLFRTMPSTLSQPIRFVEGGDVYHDEIERVSKTNKLAAARDPMFAVIGGDLAYAVDKFGILGDNLERWLIWLNGWYREMVTPAGFMIPIIPCIGNHEVIGRYQQTPDKAPYFYTLLPFPGQQGYNVLDFDHYLSIIILDSDHTHPVGGSQTSWLAHTLEARQKNLHLFAVYHVPAYPSVRNPVKSHHLILRQNWVPLFDKYGLNVAFEHHDHSYKRTHPLRLGAINPSGVVYLGDGAWGAQPRKPNAPENRWYIAKSAQETHFILVTLDSEKRLFQAINQSNEVFDQLEQKVKPVKPSEMESKTPALIPSH